MSGAKGTQGDVVKMSTSSPDRLSKSGPRKWDTDTYKAFDYNYGAIDWSARKDKLKADPEAPVCTVCSDESPKGTCVGCN